MLIPEVRSKWLLSLHLRVLQDLLCPPDTWGFLSLPLPGAPYPAKLVAIGAHKSNLVPGALEPHLHSHPSGTSPAGFLPPGWLDPLNCPSAPPRNRKLWSPPRSVHCSPGAHQIVFCQISPICCYPYLTPPAAWKGGRRLGQEAPLAPQPSPPLQAPFLSICLPSVPPGSFDSKVWDSLWSFCCGDINKAL